MGISIIIRRNDTPRVMASIKDKQRKAARDNAHTMRDFAKAIAPVKTGAFRASLYVNGPNNESDYATSVAAALRLNPKAGIVPEQRAAQPDSSTGGFRDQFGQFSQEEAIVAPAVVYGLYLEEGTVHMAPRPTLMQAAIATRTPFIGAMSKVADF